jgi:hypothetical protein
MKNPKYFFFILLFSVFSISSIAQEADSASSNRLILVEQEGIQDLLSLYQEENEVRGGIEGYRVQVFNGRKDPCMQKRMQFIKNHPDESVEILYEAPEYRVQVGNFRTQLEAEKYLNEILEEFSGSFVVKTIIKLPRLHQLKEQPQE